MTPKRIQTTWPPRQRWREGLTACLSFTGAWKHTRSAPTRWQIKREITRGTFSQIGKKQLCRRCGGGGRRRRLRHTLAPVLIGAGGSPRSIAPLTTCGRTERRRAPPLCFSRCADQINQISPDPGILENGDWRRSAGQAPAGGPGKVRLAFQSRGGRRAAAKEAAGAHGGWVDRTWNAGGNADVCPPWISSGNDSSSLNCWELAGGNLCP